MALRFAESNEARHFADNDAVCFERAFFGSQACNLGHGN